MAQCLEVLTAKLINGLRLISRTNTGRKEPALVSGEGEGKKTLKMIGKAIEKHIYSETRHAVVGGGGTCH